MSIVLFFALFIVILVIAIFHVTSLNFFQTYKLPTPATQESISVYTPVNSWGSDAAYPGSLGNCYLYTFKPTDSGLPRVGVDSIENAYNSNGAYQGGQANITPVCIDPDQIYASKRYHSCTNSIGPSAASGCVKRDGTLGRIKENEIFWNLCSIPPACSGQIGLINLNHQGTGTILTSYSYSTTQTNLSSSACLTYVGNVQNKVFKSINIGTCSIQNMNQYFRLERFTLQTSGNISFKPDISGEFARITHRSTGLALLPLLPLTTKGKIDFTTNPTFGMGVGLVDSKIGKSQGIWWQLVPRISVTGQDTSILTPQQIVYIGDLSSTTFNSDTGTWSGLTPYSLQNINNTLQMQPYIQDSTLPSTQFYNLGLFTQVVNSQISSYSF